MIEDLIQRFTALGLHDQIAVGVLSFILVVMVMYAYCHYCAWAGRVVAGVFKRRSRK